MRAFLETEHVRPGLAQPNASGFGYSSANGAKRCKTEIDQVNGLSKSIGHLLMNETFSDVTLIVDGQRFPAHRVIMASRSDYFRFVFQPILVKELSADKINQVACAAYHSEISLQILSA